MEVYPAIDLFKGKVVRLERGDYDRCRIYSKDPLETAKNWVRDGARWLHVVDLEGARSGVIQEWRVLGEILSAVRANVQFGGGVRSARDVGQLIEQGVQRIVLGTKALELSFVEKIAREYPKRIALSLDVRGDEVCIEGWTKSGSVSIFDLFKKVSPYPVECLIVTDIERDGTLEGINTKKLERIIAASPFPVIVSGGVSRVEDLQLLQPLGKNLYGVIIGKALYERRFTLPDAVRLCRNTKEG